MSADPDLEDGPRRNRRALLQLLHDGILDLPVPGSGRTADRLARLLDLARRRPVGLARLAEAHTDAVAIIAEAARHTPAPAEGPAPDAIYGVWASEHPDHRVVWDPDQCTASGSKAFCSGLGIVDHALVTATDPAGNPVLVDVDVSTLAPPEPWATPAQRDTGTGTATLEELPVRGVVGPPGFYLDRPGFWHGACGPAACWAGGAIGLVDHAQQVTDDDPHRRAHLGGMLATAWALQAVLARAGEEIDHAPADGAAGRRRALALRHTVERSCAAIADDFSQSLGPRPFVGDPAVAQRHLDVHLYTRQHHGRRDLAELADLHDHATVGDDEP